MEKLNACEGPASDCASSCLHPQMGPPPAFTAPWPADAVAPLFSDKPRVTSQSLVEDEDGDNSERLSKLPPARLEAAAGWDNEIVRSYLLDDDYSDYRGPLFTVRRCQS